MPRIPSQRTTYRRRWRFLWMASLSGFERSTTLPISHPYQQLQVPYNKSETDGTLLSLPDTQEADPSYTPIGSSHQEPPTGQLLAKPSSVYKARLQSLLNWESDEYGAIQVTFTIT